MSERDLEDLRDLIRRDSAARVREKALTFPDEDTYLKAVRVVVELSIQINREIGFRPLGGREDLLAIVPDRDFPELTDLFREKGILFESRQVRSVGELTGEERGELRRNGMRIG